MSTPTTPANTSKIASKSNSRSRFSVSFVDENKDAIIYDAKMNFLGTKLATCGSNPSASIRIFDINQNDSTQSQSGRQRQALVAELKGHKGHVWQLDWAHPKFGTLLASCSYDSRVIVWKEIEQTKWEIDYAYGGIGNHSSMNSVCWSPPEWGLMLACGGSDGSIAVLRYSEDSWHTIKIKKAHNLGCNSVSWAPSTVGQQQPVQKRFVSGGFDNLVKIWKEGNDCWIEEVRLEGHSNWIRDVAWTSSALAAAGGTKMRIASCSQDRRVIIWSKGSNQIGDTTTWTQELLGDFDDVVWRVSWDLTGNILAVSAGSSQVSLWKKQMNERWKCISDSKKF